MITENDFYAIVGNNIGAFTALKELILISPHHANTVVKLGIYGPNFYVLWNDCCQKDATKLSRLLDAYKDGRFSKEMLEEQSNKRWGNNIEI